jgi:hypothetical protein
MSALAGCGHSVSEPPGRGGDRDEHERHADALGEHVGEVHGAGSNSGASISPLKELLTQLLDLGTLLGE